MEIFLVRSVFYFFCTLSQCQKLIVFIVYSRISLPNAAEESLTGCRPAIPIRLLSSSAYVHAVKMRRPYFSSASSVSSRNALIDGPCPCPTTIRTPALESWQKYCADSPETVLLTGFHRLQEAYADHAILMYQEADMQPAFPAFSGQLYSYPCSSHIVFLILLIKFLK